MDKKKLFIAIPAFWLVIILGFIAVKEYTLQSGEEVLLKTRPVDPRDLFRGDYVILNYQISRLDLNAVNAPVSEFQKNDNVYVTLNVVEGHGTATGIYKEKPSDGLFIKGSVQSKSKNSVALEYGIESYFVPEGEGRKIEEVRGDRLNVKVSIDKFGNAVIKSLLIDGEEVRFDNISQ